MQLFSMQFFICLSVLAVLYFTVCRKYQWICLLVGSIAFFACFGAKNLLYIGITSFSIWLGGLAMGKIEEAGSRMRKAEGITKEQKKEIKRKCRRKKGWILVILLLLNFGILGYFKYWNGILDLFTGIAHSQGTVFSTYHLSGLLLPLGISFYTFQSVGYLIDVYHKKSAPESNYLKFLLFVSYFPQLLQGPINRFDPMKKQLFEKHTLTAEQVKRSMLLFLFGAMKKYAIAELLVAKISFLFDNPTDQLSGPLIVFGILMYSAQMYADFSGGIDMVMAVSELFGIRMMQNFRQPYFATSLGDFWRRWHISLGAWMRDYIFYPFALTKPMQRFSKFCGKHLNKHFGKVLPAAIANVLVFFVVGIWHGAASNFILWGLYNGIVIAVSDILRPVFEGWNKALHINPDSKRMHVWRIVRTFIIVNIGWYFDRIERFSEVLKCFKNTIVHPDPALATVRAFIVTRFAGKDAVMIVLILAALVILFAHSVRAECGADVYALLQERPRPVRYTMYLVLAVLVLFAVSYTRGSGGFLYANF